MYNTKFQVKYYNIEKELLSKINVVEEYQYQYSPQDVFDICNKLYRDELLSVFELEYFEDDKMNEMIKNVYNALMINLEFKKIIDEMLQFCFKDFFLDKMEDIPLNLKKEREDSIKKQIILTTLFSQHLFYITHKCICQQLELGTIDNELLLELKTHSIDIFTNQFV
jgi:hypothetical protein